MTKNMTDNTKSEEIKSKKPLKEDYIHAVGRRKSSVARVRLYPAYPSSLTWNEKEVKKGEIFVNGSLINEYFRSEAEKIKYNEPFRVTNTLGKVTVTIKVVGGGFAGQLDALVHGISRALSEMDAEKFRPILKKKGFLTRDSRVRERRKIGTGGKARRQKPHPKR